MVSLVRLFGENAYKQNPKKIRMRKWKEHMGVPGGNGPSMQRKTSVQL